MHRFNLTFLFLVLCCFITAEPVRSNSPLEKIFAQKKGSYPIKTQHLDENGKPKYINRLIAEDSLYLLQHAHNPVNWWSWEKAAFDAASSENKPILLSIGYSTCHWCHVMERESFENLEIADFINQHFIPIKVDREQHPDIDELYINAVQRLSGNAGWPLTAVLTPDSLPFFGGTYFPPQEFLNLLQRINQVWREERTQIIEQAERVRGALEKTNQTSASLRKLDAALIKQVFEIIAQDLAAPNSSVAGSVFPREPEMIALLDYASQTPDNSLTDPLFERLKKIANGGLHDQIGGGFHRYSVDANWQVPHFEKMLYNQAQMAHVFASAWLLSGEPRFRDVALDTYAFMLADLQAPGGGFYAAMDAESEGKEGAFYLWDLPQLAQVLNDQLLLIAAKLYKLTPHGNFANSNVLQYEPAATTADQAREIKQKLYAARIRRPAPLTDTKLITAWNAMAISVLAKGHQTFSQPIWQTAAVTAAERIWTNAWNKEERILARSIPGDTQGVLQDYAYFINALLDLYDLQDDAIWLQRASSLAETMLEKFYDEKKGAFNISANAEEKRLLVNLVSARDDAIYSGNSMASQAMVRLYHRTGDIKYRNTARTTIATFSERLLRQPQSHSGLARAANWLKHGEFGQQLYAAKAKVSARSTVEQDQLQIDIKIQKGWHINAAKVLADNLIPTKLTVTEASCANLGNIHYPRGKKISLGFQDEPLLVYEGEVTLKANLSAVNTTHCPLFAAELRLQACSDQVCLAPENLHIRIPISR